MIASRTEAAAVPTTPADPCQDTLADPAFWEHDKAVAVAASDDLQFPRAGAGDGTPSCVPYSPLAQ